MFTPVITIEAVLAGLGACGIDTAPMRAAISFPAHTDKVERVPRSIWEELWVAAAKADPRPALPTRVALGVPFGQFGTIDYLMGSSETVNGGIQSLADHFCVAASTRDLELDSSGTVNQLRVLDKSAPDPVSDEFIVAIILGRLRKTTENRFRAERIHLTGAPQEHPPHESLLCAPVVYGAPRAGFDYSTDMGELKQDSRDAGLHQTLLDLAQKLGLRCSIGSSLELSVRARLRNLLPRAQSTAERVARSLGISERTLTRRLAELGTSYQAVLDSFRMEESERLLLQGEIGLADIALTLGFSDQATWSRAFKRIHNTSPAAWATHSRRQ